MTLLKKNIIILSGALLGGITGYLYWKYIGCSSGTCSITSVWYNSIIYGFIMGGLAGSIIKDNVHAKR